MERLPKLSEKGIIDRQNIFREAAVIFLGDLRLVQRAVKHGWVVIHILDMNDYCGVVLVAVVRCHQPELILRKTRTRLSCHHPTHSGVFYSVYVCHRVIFRVWRGCVYEYCKYDGKEKNLFGMTVCICYNHGGIEGKINHNDDEEWMKTLGLSVCKYHDVQYSTVQYWVE